MSTNGSSPVSNSCVLHIEPDMTGERLTGEIRTSLSQSKQPVLLVLPDQPVNILRRPDDFLFFKRLKRQSGMHFLFIIPSNKTLRAAARRYGFMAFSSFEDLAQAMERDTLSLSHSSRFTGPLTGPLSEPLLDEEEDILSLSAPIPTVSKISLPPVVEIAAPPEASPFWEFAQEHSPSSQTKPEAKFGFYMQQYIEGESLEAYMARLNQPLEEREVLRYASRILKILVHLEQQTPPTAHGDITPANLILEAKSQQIHLVDFHGPAEQGEQKDHMIGYTAPERSAKGPHMSCDLYSLAAVMHYLLTNRDPRLSPPYMYPPVQLFQAQISGETELFLARALTYDTALRYQHARDMKRDVDALLTKLENSSSTLSEPAKHTPTEQEAPSEQSSRSTTQGRAISGSRSLHLLPAPLTQPTVPSRPVGAASKPEHDGTFFSRLAPKKRTIGVITLILVLLLGASIALPPLAGAGHHNTLQATPVGSSRGIGVAKAPDGEYIGLSDGSFAFDTSRQDGTLKTQAADKLSAGDVASAETLWTSALQLDTSDAEAAIYLENQRVLASGHPWVTMVVGTMLTGTYIGLGRNDLQGAYVAQKEYNQNLKLAGGVLIRLLIASSGNESSYATTVAQQIVQAARKDPNIIGVMGWPYSSRTLNVVKILTDAHIPIVSQMASSVQLTNISSFFFRIVPPDSVQASLGAQYIENGLHAKAAALFLDPADAYSASLGTSFKQKFLADGNSVVTTETYTVGKPDTLSTALQAALQHNPDVIYFAGVASDARALLASLPTSGQFASLDVVGGDGLYELYGYGGSNNNFGRLRFTAFAYPDEWDVQGLGQQKPTFFKEYAADFDPLHQHTASPYGYIRPEGDTILSYDAIMVMAESCNLMAAAYLDLTATNLRHALTLITGANALQGVSGQISFGPDGNTINKAVVVLNVSSQGYIQMQSVQGQFLKQH